MSARPGLFVAIVGPSGAGKDSLIRATSARLAADPGFVALKRVVTRAADASEDHFTLDVTAFEAAEREMAFALTWRAHGLAYGVPVEVEQILAAGKTVLCNLSRGAVEAARRRFPRVLAVLVTARPETLAARLQARGREAAEDRHERLARAAAAPFVFEADAVIDNDGALDDAVERLVALIRKGAAS